MVDYKDNNGNEIRRKTAIHWQRKTRPEIVEHMYSTKEIKGYKNSRYTLRTDVLGQDWLKP